MRGARQVQVLIASLAAGGMVVSVAWAFKIETHGALNRVAATASTIDGHLKDELALPGGIVEEVEQSARGIALAG